MSTTYSAYELQGDKYRTVTDINGDFGRKRQIIPYRVFNALAKRVPIGIL